MPILTKTFVMRIKQLLLLVLAGLTAQETVLRADSVTFPAIPSSPSNTIVFQLPGSAFTNWYVISNVFSGALDRTDLTNILKTYFTANITTNFSKYASLFKMGEAPVDDGNFGAAPSAMWVKSIFAYGSFLLADVRFPLNPSGSNVLHDTLIYLRREASNYFLVSELGDPAVCLFENEVDHSGVNNGISIALTNWTPIGCFAKTNFAFGTNSNNPWIVYIPGVTFTNLIVTSNTPSVTNDGCCPETAVILGLQSILANNFSNYTAMVFTNELALTNVQFKTTAYSRLTNDWNSVRSNYVNGVRIKQRVVVNDRAYVLFAPTNGVRLNQDWLYLKRTNNVWRISGMQEEDGSRLLYYLYDTCTQFTYKGPKILPAAQ